jgi:hypothetical protein
MRTAFLAFLDDAMPHDLRGTLDPKRVVNDDDDDDEAAKAKAKAKGKTALTVSSLLYFDAPSLGVGVKRWLLPRLTPEENLQYLPQHRAVVDEGEGEGEEGGALTT